MSDCVSIWKQCLEIIEQSEKISIATYKAWFVPIKPVSIEGTSLTLEVPTKDFVDKLEGEYFDLFSGAIRAIIGPNAGLKYTYHVISSSPEGVVTEPGKKHNEPMGGGPIMGVVNPFAMVGCRQLNIDPELNSNFTFDNYVIGDGNKFACSVAMAVAKSPGENAFNPLFVFGNSGVGKTHLIQAIGAEVKSNDPNRNVVYLSADRFMRQYMEATKNNSINGFLNFYQMIDVLIIDDIQEIAGKQGTENVFFQIFNHLQQNKKQIVIAADKSPAEIEGMEGRLLSRFKSGVSVEVKMPDFDTRVKIIKSKVAKDGILIPDEIIRYVATNVSGSVRELEGSLYSLLAFATLTHEDITMDVARQAVGHLVKNEIKEVNVDTIIQAVCRHYNMDESDMQKDTRKREIVVARQVAMYLCKSLTQASLSTIGMRLGNRNHATVLYSCKTVKDMIDTDKDFESHIKQIENSIRG
ncbi:MAG: chromosomal replication initiator protein DnaA [Bacteroidales bacterium]|nr:chromosomal replication initiator protein DnaA [Bacteroidales bacterium]